MIISVYELINKYARTMISQEYSIGENPRIYLKIKDSCYVTRHGAYFSNLIENDIQILELGGTNFEKGEIGPEINILMTEKKINAIVVTDTPYCKKMREFGKKLMAVLDDMAQIVGTSVELVDYELTQISKALKESACCIVKDKYTLSTGRTLYEAIVAMTVLEKSAEVCMKAEILGGAKEIFEPEAKFMRNNYITNYSKSEQNVKSAEEDSVSEGADALKTREDFGIYQDKEWKTRNLLVHYGIKLLETGLVQGTWGNISIKLDDKYMLVTPSGLDYNRVTPNDMVKVNIETLEFEGNQKPTSEKGIHRTIYLQRKDVGAIIHTHSKYCCVFAAANKDLPITQKEMQVIFGEKVNLAEYGLPGTEKLTKNTIIGLESNYGCIMANHGMICCGKDIETAFNNCVKLEKCAQMYLE